jgi:hypothetical protein
MKIAKERNSKIEEGRKRNDQQPRRKEREE